MSRFVTGVSDDLQEEFHSAMFHENMNISRLMVHPSMWKRQGLEGRVDMPRGQVLLVEFLQIISLRYKTSLDLSRFIIKFHPSFLRFMMTR